MLGSRAWRALMRRNLIYRKRNLIGSLLEICLPILFIGFLLAIKKSLEGTEGFKPKQIDPFYPPQSIKPLSFSDYVTAMQAKRECYYDDDTDQFLITGMASYNWMVPFVKCDTRMCEVDGEDAAQYCEYHVLALAPEGGSLGQERTTDFSNYILDRYSYLATSFELDKGFDFVKVFESSDEMAEYVQHVEYGNLDPTLEGGARPKIAFGVVFDGSSGEDYYDYSLRMNSTNFNIPAEEGRPAVITTPPTDRLLATYAKTDFLDACEGEDGVAYMGPYQGSCTGLYLYNGALVVQRLVQDWILQDSGAAANGGVVAEHGVSFAPFPTRAYEENGFYDSIAEFAPLLVTLGLLYPVAAMIRSLCLEKELRQKELMKIMSITESDIGWSWFVSYFSFHFVTSIFCALVTSGLYSDSEGFFLWLFWLFSFLAIINVSFFVASLFSKATRATLIGLLFFFIGYFLTLSLNYEESNYVGLVSLHPVAAFSYGLQEIGRLEDLGVGVTSESFDTTDSPSGYTFQTCLSSLVIASIFWSILTWYLNRVVKSDYGQPMPFYFPFTKAYWCPTSAGAPPHDDVDDDLVYDTSVPVEPVSALLQGQASEGQGIHIRKLKKQFGEKAAVDNLNVSMYNGQITALLGHNGAGKTTTINMLTGMLNPTDGYALVAGKDIRTQLGQIRQEIGICLQHDCLFPQLTVREHIQFFSRVKGMYGKVSYAEAEEKVDLSIQDVALTEKRNTLSCNLSGGMKRKLSVAIAFCGDSKTVLLDEPTSGMDPFSRRFTWNVIRQYRQGRCIILTTHFMDEADILGDRIIIMAEGQLRCAGSSLFLKKTYGVGYQLTIEKGRGETEHSKSVQVRDGHEVEAVETRDTDDILENIVKGAVSDASLLSNVGTEMSFQLPLAAASNFASMFDGLDKETDRGTVVSYGVGVTTLDEVFLLVARGETTEKKDFKSSRGMVEEVATVDDKSTRSRMNLEKEGLFLGHVSALFKKRAMNFRRDKKAWICTTVFPSLFVLLGFIIFKFAGLDRSLEPVALNFDDFNTGIDGKRNPIEYNNEGTEHLCQPGVCAYQEPLVISDPTNEVYTFCGVHSLVFPSSLNVTANAIFNETFENIPSTSAYCSISDSAAIVGEFTAPGADPRGVDVSTVLEASNSLAAASEVLEATQYGAVYFTHELGSAFDDVGGEGGNFSDAVVNACIENLPEYLEADECELYKGVGYVVRYNFTAIHSSPLFQALADEAIMRHYGETEKRIRVTIAPLPITDVEQGFGDAEDAFSAWFLVVLSFPFIAGAFATFVVTERESKAKHLQTVAGVEASAYWLSTFLWDIMNYQLPLWVTIILMFIFDVNVLTTTRRGIVGGVITVLALYGPAAASFTYCITFAFKNPSMCNMFVIIFSFLIAMGGPLAALILRLIGEDPSNPRDSLVLAANIVEWVLRFTPPFCMGKGIFYAINIETLEYLAGKPITVWHQDVLLLEVIFLIWESIAYLALAIQIDKWSTNPNAVSIWRKFTRILRCGCCCVSGGSANNEEATIALPDDDDVLREQERVLTGGANNDLIVVSELSKVYDNGKVAVNNISFGIPHGQCFGLLGINGAGKTTTMGILTAEFPPTSGDATLAGFSVRNEPEKTRRRIGYCPQFDAHFMNMTGREHVELYASIKGVPAEFVKEAAAEKLKEVGLNDFDSDKLSSGYSGGMKRRLSLACATIGQPQIVFLDECSTGVDPVARREIWQMISDMVSNESLPVEERTSVVLTTHSMEECEALCPNIAIMANGKLRCLGSAQHLKTKFGQGYQVELKVKVVDPSDEDYSANLTQLSKFSTSTGAIEQSNEMRFDDLFLNLDQAIAGLKELTGDDYLAELVTPDNPWGYLVYKDATSAVGVALDELASFATVERRMRNLKEFIEAEYPNCVLRERQDVKVRYEVSSENVKISTVFASIESNKERLVIAEYGVSQTTLEQVFNMHAAEAERLKVGTVDN